MADEHLGVDMAFSNTDFIIAPSGDVALASGRDCLLQDLMHRCTTPKGGLWYDAEFGVDIYSYLHTEDTLVMRLALEDELKEAVEQDPRLEPGSTVAQVESWEMGKIVVKITCRPVDEGNPINLVLGYSLTEITAEVFNSGL
ncbi:MAG: hypothetical protein M1379_00965 [Firmicutes bacterium]|nr:hypothetical protein [Bacillota bacterium]